MSPKKSDVDPLLGQRYIANKGYPTEFEYTIKDAGETYVLIRIETGDHAGRYERWGRNLVEFDELIEAKS